jgi:hypothetical protein
LGSPLLSFSFSTHVGFFLGNTRTCHVVVERF